MRTMIVVLVLFPFSAFCQCSGWNWPENKVKAEEQLVLLQDATKGKDYKQARAPLQWLLTYAPNLNRSIYIHGVEVYEGMIAAASDPAMKRRYLDSVIIIYDLRSAHCGELKNVAFRKAMTVFRYEINGTDPARVLGAMDEAFKICDQDIPDAALVPYMESMVVTQLRDKSLTQDEIQKRYQVLVDLLNRKIKLAGKDQTKKNKLLGYKTRIDQLSLKVIDVTCDFIHSTYAPAFKVTPKDTSLAKTIFAHLLLKKCPVDELWLATGKLVFEKEADFGLGKTLGVEYYLRDELEIAKSYFYRSLALASSGSDSTDILMYLGSLWAKIASPQRAREAFRAALHIQPSRTDALTKIGDLYYNSFSSCAQLINQADDRLVYLIAYDYYEKAGDTQKMELARKSFPSREEIFLLNYQAGQKMHVGCWINEFTKLRTRD